MKQILIRTFSLLLAVITANAASAQKGKLKHNTVQTHQTVTVPVVVPVTTTTVTNGTVIRQRRYPTRLRKVRHDNGLHKGWSNPKNPHSGLRVKKN